MKRNSISARVHVLFSVYHINCGVIQGFPALRKAVTTHVKKYRIIYTYFFLPRHSVGLMNERQSLHDSQYKLFVGAFSNYGGYDTKKSVSLTDNDVQTFLEGVKNQYSKRKIESCVLSGFGVSISDG